MKRKSVLGLICAFSLFSTVMTSIALSGSKKSDKDINKTTVGVDASSLINLEFNASRIEENGTANASAGAVMQFKLYGVSNSTIGTSPNGSKNYDFVTEIGGSTYDATSGAFVSNSLRMRKSSAQDLFYLELVTQSEWTSGHEYIVRIPEGANICDVGRMIKDNYIQFKIYNAGSGGWCLSKNYKNKTKAFCFYHFDDSRQGVEINNISIYMWYVPSANNYSNIWFDSTNVSYSGVLSSNQLMTNLSNYDIETYNFWTKLKFSNDRVNWTPALYVLNCSGSHYFNEGYTWRFDGLKNNDSYDSGKTWKFVKFEKGLQMPYYQYMSGTDSSNSCYILNKDIVAATIKESATTNKYYCGELDPGANSTPTLFDYGGDLASFTNQWTSNLEKTNETPKSFFNLANLMDRTIDVVFDWKVGTNGSSNSVKFVGNYNPKQEETWFYIGSDYKIRVAFIHSGGDDKDTGVYAYDVGDIVKVHMKRVFSSDYSTCSVSIWIDDIPSKIMNKTVTIQSDRYDSQGRHVMWMYNLVNGNEIRSYNDSNYSNKQYDFDIKVGGTKIGSTKVQGGTDYAHVVSNHDFDEISENYDINGYKNELGFNLNGSHIVTRNGVINLDAVKKNSITFDSNGSTDSYDSVLVSHGSTYADIDNMNPTKDGYFFEGWMNGEVPFTSSTVVDSDITLTAKWHANYEFTEFGYWRSLTQCGNDGGYKIFTLRFNGQFEGMGSNSIHDIDQNYDIGNHMYLNGVSFRELGAQSKAHIWWYPGDASGSMPNNSISFAIKETYLNTIKATERPIVSIDENTSFGGKGLAKLKVALYNDQWQLYSFGRVETLNQATLREFDSDVNNLTFETHVDYYDFAPLRDDISKIEVGTYIVVADSFAKSGYTTVGQYIENNAAGGKTYVDIKNTGKDYVNDATAQEDGYYSFKGTLAHIKDGNATKEFIPVGYVKMDGETYYGQTGDFATSLYATLLNNKDINQKANTLLSKYTTIFALSSVNGTYKFNIDYSPVSLTMTPANHGAYALTPAGNITEIVVDGRVYKETIAQNTTKYIRNTIYGVDFTDSKENVSQGFSEPTHELWTADANQASYNTAENNALVCELVGAKAIRVWVNIDNFVAPNSINWPSIGLVTRNINGKTENEPWDFDATLKANVRSCLQEYVDAGVEEITLLVNDLVRDGNSHFMTGADGTRKSLNEGGSSRADWSFVNTFPDKYIGSTDVITDEYSNFLDMNAKFFEYIGTYFGDIVTSVEVMNEINLRPFDYDYRYTDDNYLDNITEGGTLDDNAFLAECSMDYCKAMTDGIKASGAHIDVLTPSISTVGNDSTHNFSRTVNGTTYATRNFNFKRNGLEYLEECLKYIEDKGDGQFNDYFQGVNLHAYLFHRKSHAGEGVDSYLYINHPAGNVGFENQTADVDYNSNYAEDWGNDIDKYHNLLESYDDYNVPFYLTEYGIADQSSEKSEYANWYKNGFIESVLYAIDAQIKSRSFIKATYWYRIFDYVPGECSEPNYGVVNTEGYLKETGKAFYYLLNGEEYTETTPVVEVP